MTRQPHEMPGSINVAFDKAKKSLIERIISNAVLLIIALGGIGLSVWNTWHWFWLAAETDMNRSVFHLVVSFFLAQFVFFLTKITARRFNND
jgi:hypothetical protein